MITYRIKNWDDHFECAQSRKCIRMFWVAVPNKHDGKGFRRLLRHENFADIFAAWILIVQVASKQDKRGVLADRDGPFTAEDLSDCTGFSAEKFEMAFSVLTQKKIGWLEMITGSRVVAE